MPQSNDAGPASAANEANEQPTQNAPELTNQESRNAGEEQGDQQSAISDQRSSETTGDELAEHLNIPQSVRDQMKPKAKAPKAEGAGAKEEEGDAADTAAATTEDDEDAADTAAATAEDEDAADTAAATTSKPKGKAPKAPKHWPPDVQREFDKRMGKIWRQKSTADERAEQAEQVAAQLQDQLDQFSAGAQETAAAVPPGPGILGRAQNERQLDEMLGSAEAVVEFVDANPDGAETGEGDKKRFVDAAEMAGWKRNAEKILRGGEGRRRQLREFSQGRQHYDSAAQKDFPKLFDKSSEDFQTAVAIARRYPWIASTPEANYALGVMVEGFKAINGRQGKTLNAQRSTSNGRNAEGNAANGNDDLPEKLTPEYQREHVPPTAARPPNPPNRSATQSNGTLKKVEQTMERFTKPGGADKAGLARMLEALDEMGPTDPSERLVSV